MTNLSGTINQGRMGRPTLNVVETKVRISQETKDRIKAIAGNYRMADFIREAIENELSRREEKQD
ncbi:hypothetical protein [Rhizobium sp. 2MFCol3.1]|uniref:hypothetical protein n=1 Tax=Rhizobium sp. 2MFCol3.1 TaxID=1246459 RepID=UPI0003641A8A|nr:hypothetical protein [Rhizobium sp. 2MFCol3.1]